MTIYEDEIDLRPYILGIIRSWRLILLLSFLAAAVAFSISILQPREYTSTATLLLTRTRSSLLLAEQFPTERETILDSSSSMEALLSVVQSNSIALSALELIGDQLPIGARGLEDIKARIEVEAKGDSIQINALAESREMAAELANTWAQLAESAINQSYSGEQPLVEIQNQVVTTRQDYENAQKDLEAFIQENQIAVLEIGIDETQTLLSEAVNDFSWQITYYFYRKQAMQSLKIQAEALKQQLESPSQSEAGNIGDTLAIIKTRASAFGLGQYMNVREYQSEELSQKFSSNENTDLTFDLQLSELNGLNDSPTTYVNDLEQVIQQADQEISKADDILDSLSESFLLGEGDEFVETTAARLRELETQLEIQLAREKELTSNRDLAWDAYKAMVQKETEIKNNVQVNDQITLASPAVPPQKPASRGTLRNTLVAGVLGLLVGVFWVFGSMWWKSLSELFRQEKSLSATD